MNGSTEVIGANFLANSALILWIPISIAFFFLMRPDRAARVTVFGALLFLPELIFFKLPFLPPLMKQNIPYLCVILGYLLRAPRRLWRLPKERWVILVLLVIIADGIGIGLTNGDKLKFGTWRITHVPGINVKDGMFVAMETIFNVGLPFFVGRLLVREAEDMRALLRFLVKAGFIYSLLALVEIKMSPQLHAWLYGYHQHDFNQTLRFGGYRPLVFMGHGLAVGLFFAVCTMSAAILARLNPRGAIWGLSPMVSFVILGVILLLCKSTGAIVYAALAVPLLLKGSPRLQQMIALLLVAIILIYPTSRGTAVFPTKAILSVAEMAGPDRQQSLQFRFDNEDLLVNRALQRPWFGWGEYGRNQAYDGGGNIATTTDGEWIIALGVGGFLNFFARFGLLLTPIYLARRRSRQMVNMKDKRLLASTALMLAVCAVDLIPNSLFSNYPYLLSGAILSLSHTLSRAPASAFDDPRRMDAGMGYQPVG